MKRKAIALAGLLAASLTSTPATAATPSAGVAQQIRSGLFADINLGTFFTLGGRNSRNESRPSNPQAYLQLGLGYDLGKNFAVGANFGLGSSAASCFSEVSNKGDCVVDAGLPASQDNSVADNFTATMLALEGSYKHFFNDRFSLQPRLNLGYAMLDPEPRRSQDGEPISGGLIVGATVGVEYATHMDHFSIGADMYSRVIVGPNIVTLAFFPKIKYTF